MEEFTEFVSVKLWTNKNKGLFFVFFQTINTEVLKFKEGHIQRFV